MLLIVVASGVVELLPELVVVVWLVLLGVILLWLLLLVLELVLLVVVVLLLVMGLSVVRHTRRITIIKQVRIIHRACGLVVLLLLAVLLQLLSKELWGMLQR